MDRETPAETQDGERTLQPAEPPPPPRRTRWSRIKSIGILIVFGVLSYFLVRHFIARRPPPQASRLMPAEGPPVNTAVVRRGSIGIYLEAIGTVTPVYTASITSQVNGLVIGVYYKEGQVVHKGDPL